MLKTTTQRAKRRILNKTILYQKPCKQCWETFRPTRSNSQKYCSVECRTKVQKKQVEQWKEKHKENGGSSTYYKLRFEIFKRDGFTCQYCGRTPEDGIKLQIDHVRPKKHGGKYIPENLITSCLECNCGKSDILLDAEQEKRFIRAYSGHSVK